MSEVRDKRSVAPVDFSLVKSRLGSNAKNVEHLLFVYAIVMTKNGRAGELTSEQREEAKKLRSRALEPEVDNSCRKRFSVPEKALKKCKQRGISNNRDYIDNRFILLTSNVCERLFSIARFLVGERRHGLSAKSFEIQLFLHCIVHIWNSMDVNAVM